MVAGVPPTVIDDSNVHAAWLERIRALAQSSGMISVPLDWWHYITTQLIPKSSPAFSYANAGTLYLAVRSETDIQGTYAISAAAYENPPFAQDNANHEWLGRGWAVNIFPGESTFLQAAPVQEAEVTGSFVGNMACYNWKFVGKRIWMIRLNGPAWGNAITRNRGEAIAQFGNDITQMLKLLKDKFPDDRMVMLSHKGLLDHVPAYFQDVLAARTVEINSWVASELLKSSFESAGLPFDAERVKPVVVYSANDDLPV